MNFTPVKSKSKVKHKPQLCQIVGCTYEATRWYDEPLKPNRTFYFCLEHEQLDDQQFIINSVGSIEEVGVYSCSDLCEVCND